MYRFFSAVNFPDFFVRAIVTPETPTPEWGGVEFFFWTVHDISRTFEFVTPYIPPWDPLEWGGSNVIGSNDSQINPHIERLPMLKSE